MLGYRSVSLLYQGYGDSSPKGRGFAYKSFEEKNLKLSITSILLAFFFFFFFFRFLEKMGFLAPPCFIQSHAIFVIWRFVAFSFRHRISK